MSVEQTIAIIKPEIPKNAKNNITISRDKFKKIFLRYLQFQGIQLGDRYEEHLSYSQAFSHYQEKQNHPIFGEVMEYITSDVSDILLLEGDSAIKIVRKSALAMRDKYLKDSQTKLYNLIHASDSQKEADKEISLHFPNKAA